VRYYIMSYKNTTVILYYYDIKYKILKLINVHQEACIVRRFDVFLNLNLMRHCKNLWNTHMTCIMLWLSILWHHRRTPQFKNRTLSSSVKPSTYDDIYNIPYYSHTKCIYNRWSAETDKTLHWVTIIIYLHTLWSCSAAEYNILGE